MKRYYAISVAMFFIFQSFLHSAQADGRPFRGSVKWSVLLCHFSDGGAIPHDVNYYRDMFLNQGTGGLSDYWDDISYGGVNLNGSEVRGWFNMNITLAQGQALDRWGRVDACVNAAKNAPADAYQVPTGNRVAVITFPSIDMFGWNGGAFLPHDIDVGGMAHEVGHGISLNHSFSDDPNYRNADWAAIGEYDDPWDVMSWGNAFRVPTANFGDGPVGLNGKVERSHGTDQREFYQLLTYTDDVDLHAKLAEWEAFYNYYRPHGGLGVKTPYERLIEKMR